MVKNTKIFYFIKFKKLNFKHFKRFLKQRKKHAETFFNSRRLRFNYYYIKISSKVVLKQKKISFNYKNQIKKKFKLALKARKMTYLKTYCLRSLIKFSKKYLKKIYLHKIIKYKMSVFPSIWLTAKPKAVRMGKGKGTRSKKIYFLNKNDIVYELRFLRKKIINYKNKKLIILIINLYILIFLKKLNHKLPVKTIFVKKKF